MKLSLNHTRHVALLVVFCLISPSIVAQNLGNSQTKATSGDPLGSISTSTVGGPKNLAGRFGLGMSRLGPSESPALSVDWQMSQASSLQLQLSMDHTKSTNNFIVDALFSRNIFIEQALHFFIYGGAGLLSEKVGSSNKSGLLAEGGVGTRFFLSGLPYLGFSLRTGLQLRSIDGTRFGTRAYCGAHYYF